MGDTSIGHNSSGQARSNNLAQRRASAMVKVIDESRTDSSPLKEHNLETTMKKIVESLNRSIPRDNSGRND